MSKRDEKTNESEHTKEQKEQENTNKSEQKVNKPKRRIKIRRKVGLLSEQIEKEQSNAPEQIETEQIEKEQFCESERDKTEENNEEPDLLEIKIGEEEYETLDLEEELGIDRALSSQPTQNKSSRFPKKANDSASGTRESITPSTFNRGTTGTTRRFVPNNAKSANSTSSTRSKSASVASRWKWSTQIHRR